jgi:hypothetical protein
MSEVQGVRYYQFISNESQALAQADTEFTTGFYLQNGTLEYMILQFDLTMTGTTAIGTGFSDLVKRARITIDGDPVFDWVSGSDSSLGNSYMPRFSHFLNSIGGQSFTVPSAATATTGEAFIAIPLGINLTSSTPRCELTLAYQDYRNTVGGSATGCTNSLSVLGKFNSATEKQTRVISATSHAFSGSDITEQVVARVPELGQGYTVLGCYIQNNAESDGYSTGGAIRNTALSQFALSYRFQTWANGELMNGNMYSDPASNEVAQIYTAERAGALFVPLYSLEPQDLTFIITSNSASTRFFTPVLTRSIGGVDKDIPRQTAAAPASTVRSVIQRTEAN